MSTDLLEKKRLTAEEFLALPDDGIDRWLINGEVREFGTMTVRNWMHSTIMAKLTLAIGKWWEQQPPPRGLIPLRDIEPIGVRRRRWSESRAGSTSGRQSRPALV